MLLYAYGLYGRESKKAKSWKVIMPKLQPIAVEPKAMFRIHVDLLGPFEMSANGHRYIALGVCALTKYVEAARN